MAMLKDSGEEDDREIEWTRFVIKRGLEFSFNIVYFG
jgi:hypothetical protein